MKKFLIGAAVAALATVPVPASAASFLFSFAATGITGSGVFTTVDTPTAGGGYLITNTTGTVTAGANTLSITGPTDYFFADNLLFAYSDPLLSFDGTSFSLSNGNSVNLYYSPSIDAYRYIRSTNGISNVLTSFTVTPAATAAVPEPASWAMMIAGFGLVGGAMRRRQRARVSFA